MWWAAVSVPLVAVLVFVSAVWLYDRHVDRERRTRR